MHVIFVLVGPVYTLCIHLDTGLTANMTTNYSILQEMVSI